MNLSVQERRNHIAEVALEYQQQGYVVTVAPESSQLPDFLSSFPIDLLARNADETVVIEVRIRASLTEAPALNAIAKAVEGKSHWRFDLVVINPDNYQYLRFGDSALLEQSEIYYRLTEARQLAAQEYGEAAILLAWSALEAILRHLAEAEQLMDEEENFAQVLKNLFTYGWLNKEQLQILQKGLQSRDVISHGYKLQESAPRILKDMLRVADQLSEMKVAA